MGFDSLGAALRTRRNTDPKKAPGETGKMPNVT